jgi:photosystem II stability/assembly factor-like uncharacterized protein
MHESVKQVAASHTSVLQVLTLALFLLVPVTITQAAENTSEAHAIKSAQASESLLLDIVQEGSIRVAVGERGHILYSADGGGSWQQAQVPTRQMLTAVYFVDEQHGWAVGHDALILHTTDGGASWLVQHRDLELEAPLLDVWFADRQQGFAVGAYGSLLHTLDGGQHWEDIGHELDNEDGYHLNAIASLGDGTLFIAGEMGVVFRSPDLGDTWETVESPYEGSLFGVLPAQDPQSLLIYGLRGHAYRSTDQGDSWQRVGLQTPQGSPFRFGLAGGTTLADGRLVIVGHGGSVLLSKDDGATFSVWLREDRRSYAGVAERADGHLLLVGQGGLQTVQFDHDNYK